MEDTGHKTQDTDDVSITTPGKESHRQSPDSNKSSGGQQVIINKISSFPSPCARKSCVNAIFSSNGPHEKIKCFGIGS